MKITKQQLKRIIKEELSTLSEVNPAATAMKADIAAHHTAQGTTPKGTGTPVPNALDSADAWYNEFMKMIKREFNASGWSMAGIGSELLKAIERLQRQVKDEVNTANKKDYRE